VQRSKYKYFWFKDEGIFVILRMNRFTHNVELYQPYEGEWLKYHLKKPIAEEPPPPPEAAAPE
jgi:hypothetical protein